MFEKSAFDVLREVQPSVIGVIQQLLNLKQSPQQIAAKYEGRSVFLAAIVELAATHMIQEQSKE